jgi:hypothetical protein
LTTAKCGTYGERIEEESKMRRFAICFMAAWALVLLATAPSPAADQLVLGKGFLAKDPIPPDTVRRYVKVFAKEKGAGQTIVGDPTVGGATLRLIANGTNSSDQTFDLPASGWRSYSSYSGLVYYRYSNPGTGNAVKGVQIKVTSSGVFQIKVWAYGKFGPLDIKPPNPGTDAAMVLTIGGGDTYCVSFGGAAGGFLINQPPGNPFKLFAVKSPTTKLPCP